MLCMRCALGVVCAVLAFVMPGVGAAAQFADTAWVREYDGTASGADFAIDLLLDASGNVHVTGTSLGAGSNQDYFTIKYSADGDVLWNDRYNGPGNGRDSATAMFLDPAGNLYVTGSSTGTGGNTDFATLKYDATGMLLWERRYNGPASLNDVPHDLHVDPLGNVYVAGNGQGLGSGQDYVVVKYDAAGVLLWSRMYNGPGSGADTAHALAVDPDRNVYVTGTSKGLNSFLDIATLKYNEAGTQQWVARHNGPGNVDDRANDMAVDAAGNVFITGDSWGGGSKADYVTIKYTTGGNPSWVRRYDGPAGLYDRATIVRLDAAVNVHVSGGSDGYFAYDVDFATLKYDSSGTLLWERRYNGIGLGEDIASDVEIDEMGNVYVAGTSDSLHADYAILKYNADGDFLYRMQYSGVGEAFERLFGLDVDTAGGIHVTGWTQPLLGNRNYMTVKFLSCSCRFQGDGDADGFITAMDLALAIDAVFFGGTNPQDPLCPSPRVDFDCSGATDAVDIGLIIDAVFFGGLGACDPCGL